MKSILWQVLQDPANGCSSYVVGDETVAEAIVVDPLGAVGAEAYLLAAQELGVTITHIVETHVHADHLSAARELAALTGLTVSLGRAAPAVYPFRALADGDMLELGRLALTVWETPGHTPDSISLLVRDRLRGEDPWLVLTGDSLFVGDVGRPDLADPDPAQVEAAARQQFASVRRLMSLPDYVEVHPAHYGASPCGGLFMSAKPSSTIGYERRFNRMVQIPDPEAFVAQQLRLIKPPPEQAAALRGRNLGRSEDAIPYR